MADTPQQTIVDPSPKDDEIGLIDLIVVIKKWWKIPFFSFIIGFLIALAYAYGPVLLQIPPAYNWLPDTYKARSIAMFSSGGTGGGLSSLLTPEMAGLASLAGVKTPSGSSQSALAKLLCETQGFSDELNARLNLAARWSIDPSKRQTIRDRVLKTLKFANDASTNTFTITCEDTDPEFTAAFANTAMSVLEERFTVINGDMRKSEISVLEARLAETRDKMTALEKNMQAFQRKYGIIDAASAVKTQAEVTARLRSDLIMKEVQLKTYSQLYPSDDPAFVRLRTERDNLNKLITEMERGYSDYQDMGPAQNELPEITVRYSHLQRDLLVQTEVYKSLIQQYEMLKLSDNGEKRSFQILETALIPETKTGPSRSTFVGMIGLGTLFMGFLLVFILEYMVRLRSDPGIRQKLGLRNRA